MSQNAQIVNTNTRAVVNGNLNLQNIVSMNDYEEIITETLDKCYSTLTEHCGPNSQYTMLVRSGSAGINFEPNIFTRDGIRILQHIDFMAPIQQNVKEILTYIGERVDHVAKDGTTTSMMLSSSYIKQMIETKLPKLLLSELNMYDLNQLISKDFQDILNKLQTYTFNVYDFANILFGTDYTYNEEVPEVHAVKAAGEMAYIQTLTSSGGNMKLAECMRYIFSNSPRSTWDSITSYNSTRENTESFSIEKDAFDSRIRCVTMNQVFNAGLGTEYKADNVLCLVYPEDIVSNSIIIDTIEVFLKRYSDENPDTPILLLAPRVDAALLYAIQQLNIERRNPISIWHYSSESRLGGSDLNWELEVLTAISGATPHHYDQSSDFSEKHTFMAKSVHWEDGYLKFFGIVDRKEESCIHPYLDNLDEAPEFYRELLKEVYAQIDKYENGLKPDGDLWNEFLKILSPLVSIGRPILKVGGTVHEQLANHDVVQDVKGAIMASLKHGMIINGPISVLKSAQAVMSDRSEFQDPRLYRNHLDLIIKSYTDIVNIIHAKSKYGLINIMAADDNEAYLNSSDDTVHTLSEYFKTTKHGALPYPVAQPYIGVSELFKRLCELALKFGVISKIVVVDGVVTKD